MNYLTIEQIQSINRAAGPHLLKDGYLWESLNVNSPRIGSVTKTGGYTQVGSQITASYDILGLGQFVRGGSSAGTVTRATVCNGASSATIYLYTTDWSAQTGAGAGLTAGARGRFCSMPEIDTLFFVNYSDATRSYNGSSWSTSTNVTDAAQAKYINNHKSRIYLGYCYSGSTAYPTRVYYSDSAWSGSVSWDATNDYLIFPEPVTGFSICGEDQLIFTPNMVWRADAFEQHQIASVGAVNQDVIRSQGSLTIFANSYGIFVTNGAEDQKISAAINDYFDGLSSTSSMRAAILGDHYYLYLGDITLDGETITDVVIDYDFRKNQIFPLKTAVDCKEMETVEVSGLKHLYFGDDNGEIFRLFSGTSQDGQPIPSLIEFPRIIVNDSVNNFLAVDVWGENLNGLIAYAKTEREGDPVQLGELNGDRDTVKCDLTGEFFYLYFRETGTGDFYSVDRIRIGYEEVTEDL